MNEKSKIDQINVITNVRIFDGERALSDKTVVFKGEYIEAIGGKVPVGASVIDGQGKTLLPGLMDSHVHTDIKGLSDALKFGVTTELDMQGHWPIKKRKEVSERNDMLMCVLQEWVLPLKEDTQLNI